MLLTSPAAAAEYGVTLASLWQTADNPNHVFFLLDVEDVGFASLADIGSLR